MKNTPMDDYRSAFNSDAEDMNVAGNNPTPAAPEEKESPAVAVVIAEPTPEGGTADTMDPKDAQRAKSWEGRIKKREAELAAREAELAAREAQLQGDPEMMMKGGKVACKADGGKVKDDWKRMQVGENRIDVGGEPGARRTVTEITVSDDEGNQRMASRYMDNSEAADMAESLRSRNGVKMAEGGKVDPADNEAPDLFAGGDGMADPGMTTMDADMAGMAETDAAQAADPIAQLAADYGPEFVSALDALIERRARAIVEEMGGAFASEIDGKITEIMKATNDGFGLMQQEILLSVADDIEDVLESEEFTAWVESLPEAEKAKAQQVIEAGTPSQGVKLIKGYKARAQGPSPQDVWAEDAAVAVKGKSPVRLPGRPAMSPDDEYRAAFNAA